MNLPENEHKVEIPDFTKKQLHMVKVNIIRMSKTEGKKQFITALKFSGYINYLIQKEKNSKVVNYLKLMEAKLESIEDRELLIQGGINTYRTNKILALFNTSLNQTVVMKIKKSKNPSKLTCREVLDIVKKDKDTYELILNSFIKVNEIRNTLRLIKNLKHLNVHHEYTANLIEQRAKEMELLEKELTD